MSQAFLSTAEDRESELCSYYCNSLEQEGGFDPEAYQELLALCHGRESRNTPRCMCVLALQSWVVHCLLSSFIFFIYIYLLLYTICDIDQMI